MFLKIRLRKYKFLIIRGLLLLSVLISMSVMASESSQNLHQPMEDKPFLESIDNLEIKEYLNSLGHSQAYLGGYVQSFGEVVDRFFGSKDLDVVYKNNRLIIYTPLTLYDDGSSLTTVNFKAQIDLPKTNNRWKVLVSSYEGNEEDKIDSLSRSEITPSTSQQNTPTSTQNSIAGRYLLSNSENMFSQMDLGLKFIDLIEPNPYIQYRVRYKKQSTEKKLNRGTQTLYLERDKGFAWEGQHVFDYQNSQNWLSRSQTTATWWRDDGQAQLNQRGILFEKINPYRARAYFVDGNWSLINEGATFTSAGIGFNLREQLYKDWLFAELEPRATWYETDDFNQAHYSLKLMLEMHFYQGK